MTILNSEECALSEKKKKKNLTAAEAARITVTLLSLSRDYDMRSCFSARV